MGAVLRRPGSACSRSDVVPLPDAAGGNPGGRGPTGLPTAPGCGTRHPLWEPWSSPAGRPAPDHDTRRTSRARRPGHRLPPRHPRRRHHGVQPGAHLPRRLRSAPARGQHDRRRADRHEQVVRPRLRRGLRGPRRVRRGAGEGRPRARPTRCPAAPRRGRRLVRADDHRAQGPPGAVVHRSPTSTSTCSTGSCARTSSTGCSTRSACPTRRPSSSTCRRTSARSTTCRSSSRSS